MSKQKKFNGLPSQFEEILEIAACLNSKIAEYFDKETERHFNLPTESVKEKTTPLFDASWKMYEVIDLLGRYAGVLIGDNVKEYIENKDCTNFVETK